MRVAVNSCSASIERRSDQRQCNGGSDGVRVRPKCGKGGQSWDEVEIDLIVVVVDEIDGRYGRNGRLIRQLRYWDVPRHLSATAGATQGNGERREQLPNK